MIDTQVEDRNQNEGDELILERDTNGDYIARRSFDHPSAPPTTVKGVPRLLGDLQVLSSFFAPYSPPWRFVRGKKVLQVHYGFADASKSGFEASFQNPNGIWYRMGVWGKDSENESSNYRELCNLVESLEARATHGELKGVEVYLFTDNKTAERAYYRGTSSNKLLFELVCRLHRLGMHEGCILHVIHVAGTRMIKQGTDGLSRGDVGEGVMGGTQMLTFVPLHLSAGDRSPEFVHWLKTTLSYQGAPPLKDLDAMGWFEEGHALCGGEINADGIWMPKYQTGRYLWIPPPAGGLAAVEQLRRARLKRQASTHVFLIPRLFTSQWRKQLSRVSDVMFELPFLSGLWDEQIQHEPLTIAFVFPFLSFKPWQIKRAPAILGVARLLRSVWEENIQSLGPLLCQFCVQAEKLGTMPEGVVRQMLQDGSGRKFLYP